MPMAMEEQKQDHLIEDTLRQQGASEEEVQAGKQSAVAEATAVAPVAPVQQQSEDLAGITLS